MKTLPAFVAAAAALLASQAQALTITATNDAQALLQALQAPSSGLVIKPLSAQLVGLEDQSGLFTKFDLTGGGEDHAPRITLGDGIVLTTGLADAGHENTDAGFGVRSGTGASATIDGITGLNSSDQNSLKFTFTADPSAKSIQASFVYASEEYPEFAGSQFADGFAFVVDGVNYAKFQDGTAVSLKSLLSNQNLFSNLEGVYPVEYDGVTPVLNISAALDLSKTEHTLEIVVADTGDDILDSAVYLSGLTASTSAGGGGITPAIPEPSAVALFAVGLSLLGARRRLPLTGELRAS